MDTEKTSFAYAGKRRSFWSVIKEVKKKSYLVLQREIFANLKISSLEKKMFYIYRENLMGI